VSADTDRAQLALDAARAEARDAFDAWDALLWTPGTPAETLNGACLRWCDALKALRACLAQIDGCAAGVPAAGVL
jgi:hypothetical protein